MYSNGFYACRLPGNGNDIIGGAGCPQIIDPTRLEKSDICCHNNPRGFIAAPFNASDHPVLFIPGDSSFDVLTINIENCIVPDFLPEKSTPEVHHSKGVDEFQKRLKSVFSLTGTRGKIVLARTKISRSRIDIGQLFFSLCRNYPSAFVFCFYTPQTGLWIGASPEILLESDSETVKTMALAGTRPCGSTGIWDDKNTEEQRLVTDFIVNSFKEMGLSPVEGSTVTYQAGPVEHLMTPVTCKRESRQFKDILTTSFRLSPTPALSGFPRNEALRAISDCEDFRRAYYGGFCGPVLSSDEVKFYVNLRSGLFSAGSYALYAGGGITLESVREDEWIETERKLATLQSIIG